MTTLVMAQKLNAQMNLEFSASHLYVSLSNWYMEKNRPDMAVFLRAQAQKCVTHMMRVFDYMKKSGTFPVIKAVDVADNDISSFDDLLKRALENQALRTYELECLTEEARINTDNTTLVLLEDIYSEQQESIAEIKKHLCPRNTVETSPSC